MLALGVVALLLVLAPLPEGSAYPWALVVVESVIFGLIAIWQLALAFGEIPYNAFARGHKLLLPLFLFALVGDYPAPSTSADAASNRLARNLSPL